MIDSSGGDIGGSITRAAGINQGVIAITHRDIGALRMCNRTRRAAPLSCAQVHLGVSNALSASETCNNLSGLIAMAGRVVYGAGDIAGLDDGASSSTWRIVRRREHSQTVPRAFSVGGS
jgi:hypothetical protein